MVNKKTKKSTAQKGNVSASKDKKKVKKKAVKKVSVEKKAEPKVSDKVKARENRQVAGILGAVALLFIVFFVAYKVSLPETNFEHLGVEWNVIEEPGITWYHGNMSVFYPNSNRRYNLYIRNDPRENEVRTEGSYNYFKYGGVISFTPETATCRDEVARGVVVLGDFLKNAVGMRDVVSGTTNPQEFLKNPKKMLANCDIAINRSVIVIEKGEGQKVTQSSKNPFCYIITVPDCSDGETMEKFMLKVVEDFGAFEED